METFGSYGVKDENGQTKEQKDLEDVRFDALGLDYNTPGGKEKLEKIITRSKENGSLEKIKPVLAGDASSMNAIMGTLKHEFGDTYKKWGKQTKDSAKTAILENFTDDISKPEEGQRREMYASITGEITKAFAKKDGATIDEKGIEHLKKYVSGLTATKVSEIRHPTKDADLKLVGQYASAKLTNDVGKERSASSEQKDAFAAGVKAGIDEEAKEVINDSPGWGASTSDHKKKNKNPAGFRL